MALKFSSVGIIIAVAALLPATIILSIMSPFGSVGVILTLMLWVLVPVIIARLYYRFSRKEEL
ncbi:MAG: hypothetical protein E3J35_10955 [Methanomassiliicoccales archaeon]|nr:MAG: hypothetical protein E3J35_10955 [Methanomassiliicoccales archaeon]